ncbi:hypothetical protein MPPM_4306 [Methylorubrum populi]|uniref:Secreted protein n=1 Tax=Methylorubrum populi TaxID=223967 RepID=A0A160PKZ0_9HYPH|nr:hypothetical protein [Methylorubrum populi]BAU92911.1 hypothetical protein MPPM_4306 [Methylorubrum populi]
MSRPPLRVFRTLAAPAVVTLALSAPAAFAQGAAGKAGDPKAQARPASVVGCTSLANLRSLLRSAGEDRAAALAIATDPKSDLGCSPVDRAAVTGLADHVALNGRAYDCLTLKGTAVCHWTVAGAVTPPERPAGKPARGK